MGGRRGKGGMRGAREGEGTERKRGDLEIREMLVFHTAIIITCTNTVTSGGQQTHAHRQGERGKDEHTENH
jgi:hypothetical protein